MDAIFPMVQYQWTHEGCRKQYEECMEHIYRIQVEAQRQIEPFAKLASHLHSIGTTPYITMVPKEKSLDD